MVDLIFNLKCVSIGISIYVIRYPNNICFYHSYTFGKSRSRYKDYIQLHVVFYFITKVAEKNEWIKRIEKNTHAEIKTGYVLRQTQKGCKNGYVSWIHFGSSLYKFSLLMSLLFTVTSPDIEWIDDVISNIPPPGSVSIVIW